MDSSIRLFFRHPPPSKSATTNSVLCNTSACFHAYLENLLDILWPPSAAHAQVPLFGSLSTGSQLFCGWRFSASGATFRICQGLRRRKMAPSNGEKDPGTNFSNQSRMASGRRIHIHLLPRERMIGTLLMFYTRGISTMKDGGLPGIGLRRRSTGSRKELIQLLQDVAAQGEAQCPHSPFQLFHRARTENG